MKYKVTLVVQIGVMISVGEPKVGGFKPAGEVKPLASCRSFNCTLKILAEYDTYYVG
jgi:hypothetical protein